MKPWTIRWRDKTWHSRDFSTTAVHVAVANEYGREDQWQARSPWNGPEALAAWLIVLFTSEIGQPDAARLMVYAMDANEFYACLGDEEPPTPAPAPDDEMVGVPV